MEEAEMICPNRPDVMESIAGINEDMMLPWTSQTKCNGVENNLDQFSEHCDVSEMLTPYNQSD